MMASIKLAYEDTLLSCAKQCNALANSHCKETIICSDVIVSSLDCAELCRETSILWRNRSEKTTNMALLCIRACERLTTHLSTSVSDCTVQLIESCLRAKLRCREIVEHSRNSQQQRNSQLATVCYGITLPSSIYPA